MMRINTMWLKNNQNHIAVLHNYCVFTISILIFALLNISTTFAKSLLFFNLIAVFSVLRNFIFVSSPFRS